jgi:hypothetical protein
VDHVFLTCTTADASVVDRAVPDANVYTATGRIDAGVTKPRGKKPPRVAPQTGSATPSTKPLDTDDIID